MLAGWSVAPQLGQSSDETSTNDTLYAAIANNRWRWLNGVAARQVNSNLKRIKQTLNKLMEIVLGRAFACEKVKAICVLISWYKSTGMLSYFISFNWCIFLIPLLVVRHLVLNLPEDAMIGTINGLFPRGPCHRSAGYERDGEAVLNYGFLKTNITPPLASYWGLAAAWSINIVLSRLMVAHKYHVFIMKYYFQTMWT